MTAVAEAWLVHALYSSKFVTGSQMQLEPIACRKNEASKTPRASIFIEVTQLAYTESDDGLEI